MNICIIDDDKMFRNILSNDIISFFQKKGIECHIKEYDTLEKYVVYDFYFLDILLEKNSGFDVAKMILENNPYAFIIFMSTEEQFVFDVLSLKMFYFMRKSHFNRDLSVIFEKMMEYYRSVYENLEIISNRTKVLLKKDDIVYIEVHGRTSIIYTLHNTYETNASLVSLYNQLDSIKFYKMNSYIVFYFKYLKRIEDENLVFDNNIKIELKGNKKELLKSYAIYKRHLL